MTSIFLQPLTAVFHLLCFHSECHSIKGLGFPFCLCELCVFTCFHVMKRKLSQGLDTKMENKFLKIRNFFKENAVRNLLQNA